MEAENAGNKQLLINLLRERYVGKYAVRKTDPTYSFRIVDVLVFGSKMEICSSESFYARHMFAEYKIQEENPKALKKNDVFCESWQKQLDELMFGIKVADTPTVKLINTRLKEL